MVNVRVRDEFTLRNTSRHDNGRQWSIEITKPLMMSALLKDTHHLYDPDLKFMCSLYDKLILPVVHYNCEIWGFHAAREVERTHLLFCKKILKLNSRTADYFIYSELGRYPLKLN